MAKSKKTSSAQSKTADSSKARTSRSKAKKIESSKAEKEVDCQDMNGENGNGKMRCKSLVID